TEAPTSAALAAGITAAETRAERAMAPARNFCFIFMSSSSRFLVLVKQILCSCGNDSGLACVEYCSYQANFDFPIYIKKTTGEYKMAYQQKQQGTHQRDARFQ